MPCQPAQGHKPKRGDGANAEEILTAESTVWLIAFMPERALTRAKRSSEGAMPKTKKAKGAFQWSGDAKARHSHRAQPQCHPSRPVPRP